MKQSGTFLLFLLATAVLAGHAVAECVEPPAGIVSWWPGDGYTADTESGFDATLVDGASFAPGFVAEAFSFDGTDRVDLPNDVLNGIEDLTVDLWVNTTDNDGAILSGASTSEDNEFLVFPRGASFLMVVKGNLEEHPIRVDDGTWHHVAFTREEAMGRLYIDGVLIDSRTFPVGPQRFIPRRIAVRHSASGSPDSLIRFPRSSVLSLECPTRVIS